MPQTGKLIDASKRGASPNKALLLFMASLLRCPKYLIKPTKFKNRSLENKAFGFMVAFP